MATTIRRAFPRRVDAPPLSPPPDLFPADIAAMKRIGRLVLSLSLLSLVAFTLQAEEPPPAIEPARLELRDNDRIAIVGNTFAERLTEFGNFETIAALAHADKDLTFRNLGWSADELTFQRAYVPDTGYDPKHLTGMAAEETLLQPRPLNFGDMSAHLAQQKADVILLCFGMNESFRGAAGLAKFEADLVRLIDLLRGQKFNGREPPRLAIVSPIAHERLGRNLPDPAAHNEQLAAYTRVMRQVAAGEGVPFVDLFTPLAPLADAPAEQRLTFNGIHLTEYGDWVVSTLMAAELGWLPAAARIEIDARERTANANGAEIGEVAPTGKGFALRVSELPLPVAAAPAGADAHPLAPRLDPELVIRNLAPGQYVLKVDDENAIAASADQWAAGVKLPATIWQAKADEVRRVAVDKNWQFFQRWRAVNGEYIYGRRAEPFGVKSFPPEMQLLDQMVAEREATIHQTARRADEHYLQVEGAAQ